MDQRSTRGRHAFPTTHWSLIAAAGQASGEEKRAALARLLGKYHLAMRSFLLYSMWIHPDRVDDLLQRFLADKVLGQDLINRADRERGRFRSFIAAALKRFVLNCLRDDSAAKRSPTTPLAADDNLSEAVADDLDPAALFDVVWAKQVLAQAVEQMRRECAEGARPDVWGVFEGRVLIPTLGQGEPVAYQDLVERYGFATPSQASNVLVTANRMFQRVLRGVISRYEKTDEEIDDELRELRRSLSSARRPRTGGV
jgi:RNA polymerase sigma-70 factor (ECF subfamily)